MQKRILALLLALCLMAAMLPMAASAETSGVAINETNFPNEKFRSYVSENCDTDGDGSLSGEEIANVTKIDVGGSEITSLQGIEYFTALTYLYCCYTGITTLDVSKNTALIDLICWCNPITSLDVSNNTELERLYCPFNQLTELDVSNNTKLKELDCANEDGNLASSYHNQITTLDVSNNKELEMLLCGSLELTTLDISQNTKLEYLACDGNQLTTINVDNNTEIEYIDSCCEIVKTITLDDNRCFDLSTLPGGFRISEAYDWTGGTVSNGILTVDEGADKVTYKYNHGGEAGTETYVLKIATEATEQVFSDVPETAWYYSNVMKAYEKGYMSGTGDGEFSPNATLTREQMVQILYNMEGKPEVDATESKFTDVKAGQWYTNAIIWATENDVVSGYSSTKFGVGDKVTREQMAQMFYNYIVNYLKTDASKVTGDGIAKFKDADKVSSWAKTAMNWATNGGIINGNSDGTLNPLGTATRAEAASVLVNFDKFMEKYGG